MYEEAIECDSSPRVEILSDRSRHSDGLLLELSSRILNDYIKCTQGSRRKNG